MINCLRIRPAYQCPALRPPPAAPAAAAGTPGTALRNRAERARERAAGQRRAAAACGGGRSGHTPTPARRLRQRFKRKKKRNETKQNTETTHPRHKGGRIPQTPRNGILRAAAAAPRPTPPHAPHPSLPAWKRAGTHGWDAAWKPARNICRLLGRAWSNRPALRRCWRDLDQATAENRFVKLVTSPPKSSHSVAPFYFYLALGEFPPQQQFS